MDKDREKYYFRKLNGNIVVQNSQEGNIERFYIEIEKPKLSEFDLSLTHDFFLKFVCNIQSFLDLKD